MHQVFVNLSLHYFPLNWKISCQPNDAQPKIMPGLLEHAIRARSPWRRDRITRVFVSEAPIVGSVNTWTGCHIERIIIIWLTVNVSGFHLFACLKGQITHRFIFSEWHRFLVAPGDHMHHIPPSALFKRLLVSPYESQRFLLFASVNWIDLHMRLLFTKKKKRGTDVSYFGGITLFLYELFCLCFVLIESWSRRAEKTMRAVEWKCLLKCVWRSFSHQGYTVVISYKSLEWYIWLKSHWYSSIYRYIKIYWYLSRNKKIITLWIARMQVHLHPVWCNFVAVVWY